MRAEIRMLLGLGDTFRALLGTRRLAALGVFVGAGPFVATTPNGGFGAPLFADRAGLEGAPLAPLDVDASGKRIGTGDIWTGVGSNCNQWQSSDASTKGTVGSLSPSAATDWLALGSYPCSSEEYLVCVEQ